MFVWFIFSEVMFLRRVLRRAVPPRQFAMPWLGGSGDGVMTNETAVAGLSSAWPSSGPADVGGCQTIPAQGLPLDQRADPAHLGRDRDHRHHALKAGHRRALLVFPPAAILLGCSYYLDHLNLWAPRKSWAFGHLAPTSYAPARHGTCHRDPELIISIIWLQRTNGAL